MIKKLLIVIILSLSFVTVSADTNEISKQIDDKLSNINIENFNFADYKNEIILNKEIPKAKNVFEYILKIIFDEAYDSFKRLAMLIIPIIFFGILNALSLKGSEDGVSKIAYMSCYVIISTSVVYVFMDIAKLAEETILNIDVITKCMIPVLYTLMLTVGEIVSSACMQPTIIFISQIMLVIINKYLFPMIMLSFTLTITDNVLKQSRMKYIAELIIKSVKWILIFILTVFITILSAQNILGHSFDLIAVKGTKFAVTNFIPIIGGALSEGVETIGASLILIKNATGISGIVGVIVVALVPIIKIYAVSMMFYILSAVSQPIAGNSFSEVLNSAGSITSTLGVLVICMAFVFIISVAMILGGLNYV